jgi:tetratricopeptide (TPR) repeat protein
VILGLALGCLATSPGGRQQSATSSATSGTSAQPSPATAKVVSSVPNSSLPPSPLAEARVLYEKGDFEAALDKYQHIVDAKPQSPDAYAGLIRTYLKMKNVSRASETATKALEAADSVPVHVALGELYFRQGRIGDAEAEWVKVVNSGRQDAHAYMGLARVRWAISMYKSGWSMIEKAHALDPSDPDIRRAWMQRLSAKERIQFLKEYLAGDNNEDEETRTGMRHYLEFLEARAKDPRSACRLVSKSTATETTLERLLLDPSHLRGYGLNVEVNGHKTKLMLDTGASGILINRSLAEKAGVTRMADLDVGGIGDKGMKSGYRALADSLKVGGLEFQNCTVEVLDKRSVVGEDGLIGADVFSSFLVDIDFPNEKLRLKELPKRPEEGAANPLKLQSDEDEDSDSETQSGGGSASASAKDTGPKSSGPQDRYIAPEMKDYTRIFRFGHMLLVPTSIGEGPAKLFLLDTGAFTNHITPAAAREVTKVHGDSDTVIHGLSGSVKKVYSADKAVLQFGHLKQENQDLVAFDLTHISDNVGTEISGTLGFVLLRMLEVKIDYRDGLVDFEFDAKRWGR